MSSNTQIRNEVSAEEQHSDSATETVVDEPAFRPTVEMEVQAKVDANHPDARPEGMTLEAEEKFEAREAEIKQTHQRLDRRDVPAREGRTRAVVTDRPRGEPAPEQVDPRERLSQAELATVNERAAAMAAELERSRADLAKRLARRVRMGDEILDAMLAVKQAVYADGPTPLAALAEAPTGQVDVEGHVVTLWEPSSRKIQQVGLLSDDSGQSKFTIWRKSDQPMVREGEFIRIRNAAKNWYQGRCSLALTRRSDLSFPERGRWWE